MSDIGPALSELIAPSFGCMACRANDAAHSDCHRCSLLARAAREIHQFAPDLAKSIAASQSRSSVVPKTVAFSAWLERTACELSSADSCTVSWSRAHAPEYAVRLLPHYSAYIHVIAQQTLARRLMVLNVILLPACVLPAIRLWALSVLHEPHHYIPATLDTQAR